MKALVRNHVNIYHTLGLNVGACNFSMEYIMFVMHHIMFEFKKVRVMKLPIRTL